MPSYEPVPTLPSIIANASSNASDAKQDLVGNTLVGQITNLVSSIPIKPATMAANREDAIGKYMTGRYNMNGGLNLSDDVLYDTYGENPLSISLGTAGSKPVSFQAGVPPLLTGFSVRFNGNNEGLTSPNNYISSTQFANNYWQVEVMFKPEVLSSGSPRAIWTIEDSTIGYGLFINSSGILQFWNRVAGTFTTLHNVACSVGSWYNVVISYHAGSNLIIPLINGNSTSPSNISVSALSLGASSTFNLGFSPAIKNSSTNSTLNGCIEDVVVYNANTEDRPTFWQGSNSSGNNPYYYTWRYNSSYVYKNPPPGWILCNGEILEINKFAKLFEQIKTTYGGNGTTTFALPPTTGLPGYTLIRAK